MATFDRFEICSAYALYAMLWGGDGQTYENSIQVRLKRVGFLWGSTPDAYTALGLNENGREIYTNLVKQHHNTVSGDVPCECCGESTPGTLCVSKADGHTFPAGGDVCDGCAEEIE